MAANDMRIVDIDMPTSSIDDEVLIEIKAGGICGSDLHIYKGENASIQLPRVIGHELVGIVVEKASSVNHVEVGDHVVIDNVISCGECYACKIGRHNVCKNLRPLGVHVEGGFQQFFKISGKNVYKISKDIPFEHAAIVELYSIVSQSINRSRITKDDNVLICGSGPLGLMLVEACKRVGAKVAILDVIDKRLNIAKKFDVDEIINAKTDDVDKKIADFTDGEGFSLIFEATGNIGVFEKCIDNYPSQAGRIVILGFPDEHAKIKPSSIMRKELDIIGSRVNNYQFETAIKWVEDGLVNPDIIVTNKFRYEDVQEAFDACFAHPDEILKAVLMF